MSATTYARRLAATAATVALAVRCGGDGPSGPTKLSDPALTATQIERLSTVFAAAPYRSYAFAMSFVSPGAGFAARVDGLLRVGPRLVDPRASTRIRPELHLWKAPASADVIPPEARGKTFEWDQAGWGYVPTSRPGAPANGVRFILYAVGEFGDLSQPLQEIGYADLVDQSTSTADRARVVVVVGGITYVDYVATCTPGIAEATVNGVVTDGSHSLNVNGTLTTKPSGAVADIRYDLNAENLHARLKFDLAVSGPITLVIDFRLQLGPDVVTVAGTDRLIDGSESGALTVRVNGGHFATITITDGDVGYEGAAGALTTEELTALDAMIRAIGDIVASFTDLLGPLSSCPSGF